MKYLEYLKCSCALVTRLAVGFVFLQSGWGKLHNLSRVTEFFTSLGIPFPSIMTPFVASTEFVAGLLLILGIGSRLMGLTIIGLMSVAIITAKKTDIKEFSDLFALCEFTYILLMFWIATYGPGTLSVDHLLAKKYAHLRNKKWPFQ